MFKILALTILIFIAGCSTPVLYDKPVIIIEKAFSDEEGYRYRYIIEILHKKVGILAYSPTINYVKFYFYTNDNWGVGDTIWMGARWGKHNKPNEE